MKVQPAVALFANRKLRLEANEVASDMPKALAFLHLPLLAKLWKSGRKEAHDRVLASEHCFAVVLGESTSHQFRDRFGFARAITDIGLGIAKVNFGFQVSQRTLQRELDLRFFVGLPARRRRSRDRIAAGAAICLLVTGLITCRPTASECAQMIPLTRESRHKQRFSTSMAFRNFSPARKDLPPSVSLPLSKGGS